MRNCTSEAVIDPRNDDWRYRKPRYCAAFLFYEQLAHQGLRRPPSNARMTRGDQRRRDVVGPPVAASATTRPLYLSGPILSIVTPPSPSRPRRALRRLRQLQFLRTGRLQFRRIDAAQANPRRQIEPGPQMHPRLEGVAIDGPDHVDRVPDTGISGALPDHFAVARRLAFGGRHRGGGTGQSTIAAAAASFPPPRPE